MNLKEYLNQKDPQRFPTVWIERNQLIISSRINIGSEIRRRVYFKTANPLLSGICYCLIGTVLYTTDNDGNPRSRSCFRIKNEIN